MQGWEEFFFPRAASNPTLDRDGSEGLGGVGAERFFGQIVAGHRISAGARAAADILVLTKAALAFQLGSVAQFEEQG